MDTRPHPEWIAAFAAYLPRRFPDRTTSRHDVHDLQRFVHFQPTPLPSVTCADSAACVDAARTRGCAPATVNQRVATLTTCCLSGGGPGHPPRAPIR